MRVKSGDDSSGDYYHYGRTYLKNVVQVAQGLLHRQELIVDKMPTVRVYLLHA